VAKHKKVSEEERPARRFADRKEAQAAADTITNTPRKGVARVQRVGAWDCWIVEVRPRKNQYGNPAVLRVDGSVEQYV
jgi:hypothetical protein